MLANNEQLNLDLFEDAHRWPRKPYCSADKTASSIRTLQHALKHPYIQANPPHLRVWSIFDVDQPASAGKKATFRRPPGPPSIAKAPKGIWYGACLFPCW